MIIAAIILLAAFFNAVMDATENRPNFNESRLKRWPQSFWLKEVSWRHAKKIFGYKIDAWHIAKSCMILCFFAVALLMYYDNPMARWNLEVWEQCAIFFAAAGILWNGGFWLFYHKLLGVK